MRAFQQIIMATIFIFTFCGVQGETVAIKVNRDNSISDHPQERTNTNGSRPKFKVKWFEEFGIIDADFSSLKGKVVSKGYLYLKATDGPVHNINQGIDLTWISISTVSSQWDEMKSCSKENGLDGNWGWPGAKAYDVIGGNGNTLRCNVKLEPKNGWHRVELTKEVIAALISSASSGLFIMDGSGYYMINTKFFSHEQNGQGPYFEFEISGTDNEAPAVAQNVTVIPEPLEASADTGAVKISLVVPKTAVSYNISVSGEKVKRWAIPFAANEGTVQTFILRDLKPSTDYKFVISSVDASGNQSAEATVNAKSSSSLQVPKPATVTFQPVAGEPKAIKGVTVYAFPELMKINPVSSELIHEKIADFKQKNAVWSGANSLVRMASAKGEIISFQLGFDGAFQDFKIQVSDLTGASKVSNSNVKIWRNWYVKNHSEYALPFKGTLNCPMEDNKIEGQKHQAVTVDYYIPQDIKEGVYKGKITVSSGADTMNLELEVKVYKAVIPADIHFNPELNCYSGPGAAGSEMFNNSHKLAHYNRCAINRVPYSQSGRVHDDYAPTVGSDGRVLNWDNFDKNLGGLLDGTLFKDNPRAGVPVASFYLPLFEGFPLDFRKFYKTDSSLKVYQPAEFQKLPNKEQQNYTTIQRAKQLPVEEAFSQSYKENFTGCVKDFYKHFEEKGWNKSLVQFYLNNKENYGYSYWTLDEPVIYRDWEALNFFARLWKEGINDPYVYTKSGLNEIFEKGLIRKKPTFLFRGDISRIHWQGNLSDNLMNIVYLGGGGNDMPRLIRNSKERMPTILYAYGACLAYQENTWGNAAWCLKAFLNESDGVLPWQSLGNGLNNPDPDGNGNALIVDAGEYGNAIASFRVHALRRGAQDAELLRLLQLKNKWSRGHVNLFVSNVINLIGDYKQAFNDEAAAQSFKNLEGQKFIDLKEILLMELEK